MFHRWETRLPTQAWSPPFALALVVVVVELYVLVFLQLVSIPGLAGDFLRYQWFVEVFTAGGVVERGLPFEVMKINILLVIYLWLCSRGMRFRREATHRVGLIAAAAMLMALQVLLALSSDLTRPRFTLEPIS